MKIRLKPLVVTLVVSMTVLIGGWFLYQNVAIQSPVEQIAKEVSDVTAAKANVTNDKIQLSIQVQPDANIRQIVERIQKESKSTLDHKKLEIVVSNPSSEALDDWWSTALFAVAQAMENKQYTDIPKALEQASASMNQDQFKATAEMDEHNVYISLTDGKASKYIILPLQGESVGVWPNENA